MSPFFAPSGAVLSSRCRLERSVWFGRMSLFSDRIEIAGIGAAGLFRRTIPVEQIQRVTWRNFDGAGVDLHLVGGERIAVNVRAAGLWKYTLLEHLPRATTADAPAPGDGSADALRASPGERLFSSAA